jgi:hypothetical protein
MLSLTGFPFLVSGAAFGLAGATGVSFFGVCFGAIQIELKS